MGLPVSGLRAGWPLKGRPETLLVRRWCAFGPRYAFVLVASALALGSTLLACPGVRLLMCNCWPPPAP
jgi:hypothetical protein